MKNSLPVVVWHRNNFRIQDNALIVSAVSTGAPILPVFILDEEAEGAWKRGSASRWWLHHSLKALDESYQKLGLQLLCFVGDSADCILQLCDMSGAKEIFASRRFEPALLEADRKLIAKLQKKDLVVHGFNTHLLMDPYSLKNQSGKPFQVFTPFWKKFRSEFKALSEDQLSKEGLLRNESWKKSGPFVDQCLKKIKSLKTIEQMNLLPNKKWDAGFYEQWVPGERGAHERLKQFLDGIAEHYKEGRDIPSESGTSMLSPHLHFGEISPLRVWSAIENLKKSTRKESMRDSLETYLKELAWREFAHHLLFHFPHTTDLALRSEYDRFPWEKRDSKKWKAWTKGLTGFPIIDAGMRQLWHTGWMHNRVRMIVASFLVKDFRYSWLDGAKWFWDTLVDADLASNTMGWQWSGGCGADAAPYFRVFNPTLQGERFDPKGVYVRKWVPELAKLSDEWIHQPWNAPADVLKAAGIQLGSHYPKPIVDHSEERDKALKAFQIFRSGKM